MIVPNHILIEEIDALIKEGHCPIFKVKGNSMLPFIVGDLDSVELHKADIVKVYDIVLAEIAPKTYVLHRVIDIKEDKILLMGDGNIKGTEQSSIGQVVGKTNIVIHPDNSRTDLSTWQLKLAQRLWLCLRPLRRYLLAIARRTFLKKKLQSAMQH